MEFPNHCTSQWRKRQSFAYANVKLLIVCKPQFLPPWKKALWEEGSN